MTTDNPPGAAPSAQQREIGGSACAPAVGDAAGRERTDDDCVMVPRGLIAAACAAIDRKHDAPKTLAQLRRYTFGDLSGPQVEQQPPVAPDEVMRKVELTLARCLKHVRGDLETEVNQARAALRSLRPLPSHQATPPAESAQGRPSEADPASSQAAPRLDGSGK